MTRPLLLLTLAGLLLTEWFASAFGQTIANSKPVPRSKLPRDHEYQRVLIEYLGSLRSEDFAHGVVAKLTNEPVEHDAETLFRTTIFTRMTQPLVGTKRGPPAINAPPECFLLSAIETPQGVMRPPVWPETLIPLVQWNYPGNPFHNNRGLKLRAFATAMANMLMVDADFDDDPKAGRADLFSYQLVYFGLPYPGFRDVLPERVRKAYEAGLRKHGERVIQWGVRWEDPQSDLIAPLGLWCIARVLADPVFSAQVETFAKRLYSDPAYFRPAGYWTFRGGLDIPFNGQANLFAVTTGLAANWPFVNEALAKTYRLRSHLILREPDGALTGPSHFNSRVAGPASVDQWSWGTIRDLAAAMLTDEAAHLNTLPSDGELKNSPALKAAQFNSQIAENPVKMLNGVPVTPNEHYRNEELANHPWERRIWMTYNFPASVNPGHEFYRPGAYAHFKKLVAENSPYLKSPFERGENFIRAFEKDFVVCKQPGFAAILHVGSIGGQDPNDGLRQFPGPMGLSGGQLSAFWTPHTGCVILGQRGGMTSGKSFDAIDNWRNWPNHAVSGLTAAGVFFTSARIQRPDVSLQIMGQTAVVTVAGIVPPNVVGQTPTILGKYEYSRQFQIDGAGIAIETTLRGDGKDQIVELYETLPVYLRDSQRQPTVVPTKFEFLVAEKWTQATESLVRASAVRLTRFDHAVLITFDRARRVKLSPEEWSDTYISRGMGRNVLINLRDADDAEPVIEPKSIRYRLTSTTPEAPNRN